MKIRNITKIILLLVIILSSGCTSEKSNVADIVLNSAQGETKLSSYKNKLILLSFGYTHCPDICPATLSHVSHAMDLLSKSEKERVQPIFVTLDPERDTLDKLEEYFGFFGGNILGVSVDSGQSESFLKAFSIESFKDGDEEDYTINHSTYLFLLDDQAKVLDMMGHKTSGEFIVESIRNKFKEK